MQDPNDFSDLGAVPVDDFSDLGAVPIKERPSRLAKLGSKIAEYSEPAVDVLGGAAKWIGQKGLDTAEHLGSGMTAGLSDEIGGLIGAGAETLYNKYGNPLDEELRKQGFKLEEPGFGDLYRQNQQAAQKELEASKERSPYLSLAAELTGGAVTGGAAMGALGLGGTAGRATLSEIAANQGKLKALGELGLRSAKSILPNAAIGAISGATTSEKGGILTPEERSQLGEDVASGAILGGALGPAAELLGAGTEAALSPVKKIWGNLGKGAAEVIEKHPILRRGQLSWDYGTEDINPKSEFARKIIPEKEGSGVLAHIDENNANEMLNSIRSMTESVGKDVRSSLANSTKTVDLKKTASDALGNIWEIANKYPEITSDKDLRLVFQKIDEKGMKGVTPIEAHDVIEYVDDAIAHFKPSALTDHTSKGILDSLYKTRRELSNTLQQQVPEYGLQAKRYAEVMRIPEQLISGSTPVGNTDVYYNSLKGADEKAFKKMRDLVKNASSSGEAEVAYNNLIGQIQNFETNEALRVAKGKVNPSIIGTEGIDKSAFEKTKGTFGNQYDTKEFAKKLRAYSDDAILRGEGQGLNAKKGSLGYVSQALLGVGELGEAGLTSGANLASRLRKPIKSALTQNPGAKMSRYLFNAPNETLSELSNKFKQIPVLKNYGQNLEKALQSPQTMKKNQVLFTIMQNPSAKKVVDEHADEQQE